MLQVPLETELKKYFDGLVREIELKLMRKRWTRRAWDELAQEGTGRRPRPLQLLDLLDSDQNWELIIAAAPEKCRDFGHEVICDSSFTVYHSELYIYAELVLAAAVASRLSHWGLSGRLFLKDVEEAREASDGTIEKLLREHVDVVQLSSADVNCSATPDVIPADQ